MHVVDLAQRAAVTPATVRYYSRVGLISSRKDPRNGYRRFSDLDVERIKFVRRAQALGLTIRDIKRLLRSADNGNDAHELAKSMVEDRLKRVREQISELCATEARITRAITTWRVRERLDMTNAHDDQGSINHLVRSVAHLCNTQAAD